MAWLERGTASRAALPRADLSSLESAPVADPRARGCDRPLRSGGPSLDRRAATSSPRPSLLSLATPATVPSSQLEVRSRSTDAGETRLTRHWDGLPAS